MTLVRDVTAYPNVGRSVGSIDHLLTEIGLSDAPHFAASR